jgi:hypothetical protein
VRAEQVALSDDAIVIRGGRQRDSSVIVTGLQQVVDDGGSPNLSVYAADPFPGDVLVTVAWLVKESQIPHTNVQVSTIGRLRASGFEILEVRRPDEPTCHYEYSFSLPLDQYEVRRWISCFNDPIPTPRI